MQVDKTYLKKWAKKSGKTMEELEELWEQAVQAMKRVGLEEDERAVQGAFRRKLRGSVFGKKKGGSKRTPQEFLGFVFGASRLIDWDEIRRQKALKRYNEDPQQAVLEGITDESGNPLDNREKMWKFGEQVDNPNFRKPLVGHAYERKVLGIAKKEGDDTPQVFRLNLRGKTAAEFKGWKPFVAVRFLALCYNDKEWYELYPSKLTKFTTEKKEKIDFEQWIRSAGHVYKLDKIDQAFENTKDAKDNWTFIEADLDYIFPNVDEDRKQRSVNIADDAVGLQTFRVRIPEDFPVIFSEFSRVIVMGVIQKFKRRDSSMATAIEGYGIFPIPGKSVEMPEKNGLPAEPKAEEPIILWE